jgi:hypothetical protein
MRLTEFGKVIGRGQGQEAGQTFQRECVGRKPISLATCTRVKKEMMCGSRKELTGVLATRIGIATRTSAPSAPALHLVVPRGISMQKCSAESIQVSNSYAFPYKYRLRLQERSQRLPNEAAICRALATFGGQYSGNQRRHVLHPHQERGQASHQNDSHESDYTFISIDLSNFLDVMGTGMQGNILSVYKCIAFSDLFRYSHSNLLSLYLF